MIGRQLCNQARWLCAAGVIVVILAAAGCGDEEACNLGTTKCGAMCVDTSIDTRNCGSCYSSCKAGETCSNGKCTLSCQSTLTNCSGTCVNSTTDRDNCGTCGTKCATAEVCVAGKCASQCPSALTTCSNTCVNTNTDRDNCGACGTKCNSGEVCSAGKCALSCQTGLTACSNTCVNLQKDSSHCGKCGSICGLGTVCSGGTCQTSCGNSKVDPGEQCDGSVPAGMTCIKLGHDGGTLSCTTKCAFDITKCHRCGDAVVSSPVEECDGKNYGGKTCESLGYSGGSLACVACKLDSGACTLPDVCGKPAILDISKGSAKVKASTKAATSTVNLTSAGCTKDVTPGPDLFYSVKLVGGFTYKITLTPETAFDPALYLFTDCTNAEATCLGGSDSIGAGKVETVTYSPTASGTFYIAVDSWTATGLSGKGSFTLEVALDSPGVWATVAPGAFMMGTPSYEACRSTNEAHHQVMLTNKYQISKTEVTQAQYKAVMGSNPSKFTACGDQCPVELVNWSMAAAYCNALSKQMGYKECYSCTGSGTSISCSAAAGYSKEKVYSCPGYRLPTEAEWERAYRAGTATPFYNGNNDGPVCASCTLIDAKADLIAWYCFNSTDTTHPVGKKTANSMGIHDMAGNVYELCNDVYQENLGNSPQTDPWGAASGTDRVIRGGSYTSKPYSIRAATRWKNELIKAYINVGFRCARTVK